jgi:hypothetical protein
MLRFIVILLTAATLLATSAFAGPGHSHDGPFTEMEAIKDASAYIADFVQKGRLDASWSEVEATEVQKKTIEYSQEEWVVIFSNPNESDPKKKTLYVFFNSYGEFSRTNFTGR